MTTPLLRIKADEGYLDKLAKLVPAEAISAYLALINIAAADTNLVKWAFAIGIGIAFFVRIFGSTDPTHLKQADFIMVAISLVAFVLWVYSIGGSTGGPFKAYYNLFWGTASIVVFTIVAPYLHGGGQKIVEKFSSKPA